MKIGITGHRNLPNPTSWDWVDSQLKRELSQIANPTGVSCLAEGADQVLAQLVLELGGSLIAVIPYSKDFDQSFDTSEGRDGYLALRNQAIEVKVLPDKPDKEDSYLEAGLMVVDLCDVLFAVWDGQPAKGKGGTGDVVEYALKSSKSVLHFDPINRTIEKLNINS